MQMVGASTSTDDAAIPSSFFVASTSPAVSPISSFSFFLDLARLCNGVIVAAAAMWGNRARIFGCLPLG